jgi:hypothetical protein
MQAVPARLFDAAFEKYKIEKPPLGNYHFANSLGAGVIQTNQGGEGFCKHVFCFKRLINI